MSKKLFLRLLGLSSLLLTGGMGTAWAGPITPSQALKIAEQAFAKNGGARSLSAGVCRLTYTEPATPVSATTARSLNATEATPNLYYVINRGSGEGYAVVSGDDRTSTLLAFAEEGQLDDEALSSNPGVRYILGHYAEQVQWAIEHLADQGQTLRASTSESSLNVGLHPLLRLSSDRQTVLPEAISWGQSWPFNAYSPRMTVRGKSYPTVSGCVATAISTAMRWHQWPDRPQGRTGYNWYGNWLSVDFDREVGYDWTKMPAAVSGRGINRETNEACTEDEADNIGRLLRDVGYSIRMGFGRAQDGGSGTQVYYAVDPLVKNFKYKSGLKHINRQRYTDAQWWQQVTDELENYGPVVYAGFSKGGGHCFILDGYATRPNGRYIDNYVHVDWGWTRSENGWYLLDVLQPGSEGIGGGDGSGYGDGQQMLRYLAPDRPDNPNPAPKPQPKPDVRPQPQGYKISITSDASRLSLTPDKRKEGKVTFTLSNTGNGKYDGMIRIFAVPSGGDPLRDYKDVALIRDDAKYTIEARGKRTITYQLDLSPLDNGDYKLYVGYSISQESNRYVRDDHNDLVPICHLRLIAKEDPQPTPTPKPKPKPQPQQKKLHITSTATPTTLQAARDQVVTLGINNSDFFGYYSELALCIATPSAESSKTILATKEVRIAGKRTNKVEFKVDLSAYEPGSYKLYVAYHPEDYARRNQWVYLSEEAGSITIQARQEPKTYVLSLAQADERVTAVEGDEKISVKFTVMNSGKLTYNSTMALHAVRIERSVEVGAPIELVRASGTKELVAGGATEVTCYAPIVALQPGYYRLYFSYLNEKGEMTYLTEALSQEKAPVGTLVLQKKPEPKPEPTPQPRKRLYVQPVQANFYQGGRFLGSSYAKVKKTRFDNAFSVRLYMVASQDYRGPVHFYVTDGFNEDVVIPATLKKMNIAIAGNTKGYVDLAFNVFDLKLGFHKIILHYQDERGKWFRENLRGIPFEVVGAANYYRNDEEDDSHVMTGKKSAPSFDIRFRSIEVGENPKNEGTDNSNSQLEPTHEAQADGYQLFPTEAVSEITIKTPQAATAQLFDLSGHLIRTIQLSADGMTSANVSDLNAGQYFLRIGKKTLRFIKR